VVKGRNGADMRKERIQEIAQFLQRLLNKNPQLILSNTLAELQYQFGLTESKLLEYMIILEKRGQFVIDRVNDKILKPSETQ